MKLTEKDFEMLRDFIYSVCGIYFQSSKKYFLESRIAQRMAQAGTPDPAAYLALLRNAVRGTEELKRLLNDITTNETFFFRNVAQLTALQQQFLPALIEGKAKTGFRKLRIWSAASSSGEEAYTLAMLLLEKFQQQLKGWIIEIIGTDINETVLEQARAGIYTTYSVRNIDEQYRKKYFTVDGQGRFILAPEVKKMVSFSRLNLNDDTKMLFMKSFDIIFCANVLIYFDTASKSKVVQHFYNNLQPYGYFFVGQAESLHGVNDKFKAVHFPGGFAYKK
ncbi:MAG: protein-glutamate O-methyltransferase CheR [Desulfobacteraceae bacterium]|nr:protein-glutamate O-methyltransferase CheR [Desulfobacteraceae bacterium]